MSEIIKFNTEESIQNLNISKTNESITTFKLVSEDDPILKMVLPEFDFINPPVNPNNFASSLVETCIANKGFGLSANQCGFKHRVFVMGSDKEYVAFFNPKIIKEYGSCHMIEGCLSFSLLALSITRPESIDVEYQDYNGSIKKSHFTGISARVFQHELDHLNGKTFLEKAKPMAVQSGLKKRNKINKLISKMDKNLEKLNHGNTN